MSPAPAGPLPRYGSFASLRGKLTLILITTVTVALLTLAVALLYRDLADYRDTLAADLQTQAGVMELLAAPALALDDREAARRNLQALSQSPRIIAAALYAADGSLFASYSRDSATAPPLLAPPPGSGVRLEGSRMDLARGIRHDGELLGSIYLRGDYDRWQHIQGYLGIVATMLLLSLGVALLLAVIMRRAVTGPVETLVAVADDIVSRRDLSRRAPDTPVEEFAVVMRAFNSVLDEAEERTRELRKSEQLYRAIGESIDYGVWVCDATGRTVYISDCFLRLVGLTQQQCGELGWTDVLHPDDLDPTLSAWIDCVESGQAWYHEHRFLGVDGRYHPVLAQGVPMRDEHGRITGWAGINLDVSRIKQTEDALREADRRKDDFLATLAHELRNPLAPIRHAARLLDQDGVDETQARMARDIIGRQVARMALLLDDLLEVSRITRGRLELRKERVALATLVRSAVETSRPVIDAKRHELVVELPGTEVLLDADPLRLSQALSNLLTNAAKYTDEGGRIELRAQCVDSQLVLTVKDTGIGLPQSALPTIFEMFSQVDSAIDRSEGGLGIGLALVKGLVLLHGGTVEADSPGLGQGATFTVRLPADCVLSGEGPEPTVPVAAQPGHNRGRVLVVDDNVDAASALAMVLAGAGHTVYTEHNGEDALRTGWQQRPDAVLLDIGMPDLTGYDVARRMRATEWGEGVLLIALTGWGQKEDIARAESAGFDVHMTKPADPERIERLVEEYLGRRGAGREGES